MSVRGAVSAKVTGHPREVGGRAAQFEQLRSRREGDPDRASAAGKLRHDVRTGRPARRARVRHCVSRPFGVAR
jgi:hypothetical protein